MMADGQCLRGWYYVLIEVSEARSLERRLRQMAEAKPVAAAPITLAPQVDDDGCDLELEIEGVRQLDRNHWCVLVANQWVEIEFVRPEERFILKAA